MKNKQKILHIDIDGVIADFDAYIDTELQYITQNAPYDDVSGLSRSDQVNMICSMHPDMFAELAPIPGAINAVKKLNNLFEIFFLSTPMWEVPESNSGKRIWVESMFGDIAKKKLILTHRKDLVIGDFLVDDRLKNGAAEFTGEHIHFGTEKFPDWDAVVSYLLKTCSHP